MTAFHAAYARGELVTPPWEYIDLVLVPGVLHTPTAIFRQLPEPEQMRTRKLLQYYLAAGWGGNPGIVKRDRNAEL